MRSKSIVLIVIAAVCGTVAATAVSQAVRTPAGGPAAIIETEKVFVAAKEIDIREPFSAENIRLEEWPKNKVPEGAIAKLEEIEGQYSRTRLFQGEVILHQKLMSKDEVGSHEVTIPEGYRVKSVQVTMASAVSNLIMPGSRVDVLVFLKEGAGISKTGAYTILKNVRVFAVNDRVDRDTDAEGKTISAKTVSLLVKPDQVEKLLVGSAVGRLELSLRRPDDESDDVEADDDMTALSELIRGGGDFGIDQRPASPEPARPAAQAFANFLQQSEPPANTQLAAVSTGPLAQMIVMTPDGIKQYRWKDPHQLPEEVQESLTAMPAPIAPYPAQVESLDSGFPGSDEGAAAGKAFAPENAGTEANPN